MVLTVLANNEVLELDDEGLLSILFDPESSYRANGSITFEPIPLPYTTGLQYIDADTVDPS